MPNTPRKTLDRELGLVAVMAISMGAMLGSGIFVLPGVAVDSAKGFAGGAMPLAFLISALLVLPAALCKAELATALPRSGGTYLYVERGMGPLAGTVVGLGVWFSLVFKSAFALVGLGAYFAFACGLSSEQHADLLIGLAAGICVALALLNLLGVRKSSKVQNVIVTLALIGLAVFVIASAPHVETQRLTSAVQDTDASTLLATSALVFVSFAGVTKICSIAEEVKDPDKNLPRGILLSLLLITIIYIIVTSILVTVVDVDADLGTVGERELGSFAGSTTPLATVTSAALGPIAGVAMAILATLTLTSMANSGLMTSSRFPLAMARDKLIPEGLSKISPRFRTPLASILVTGGLMCSLVLFVDVVSLAKLASAFKLLVFGIVNLSVIVMRESGARWYKPTFSVPGYPAVPLLGFLGCVILLFFLGGLAYAGAGGIVCVGVVWYWVFVRKRVSREGAVKRLYGETRRLSSRVSGRQRRPDSIGVIVPIFERDEDIEDLIPLAAMVAERGARLKVLRIEEVPDQSNLGMFAETDPLTVNIAQRVDNIAQAYALPCSFEDVVTHHAKHVLYERAMASNASWIVMRWQQRSSWRWFVPDPVAWFVHHPPCDLVLFRETPGIDAAGLERFKKLLVFAEPGPNDAIVVHVADRFAVSQDASLTFVYLLPDGEDPEDEEVARTYHENVSEMCQGPVGEPLLIRAEDDLAALLETARDYDLLVLGAPPPSESRGAFRRSFEDRVTEQAPCAVLRLKAGRETPHEAATRTVQPSQLLQSDESGRQRIPRGTGFCLGDVLDHVSFAKAGELESKPQLFEAIAAGFDSRHPVGASTLEEAFWERERRQSTALGRSVALPHATVRNLDRAYVDLWILEEGIPFKDAANTVVDVVFVVVAPEGERRDHLRILARIGHLVLRPEFLIALRRTRTDEEVRAMLDEFEGRL